MADLATTLRHRQGALAGNSDLSSTLAKRLTSGVGRAVGQSQRRLSDLVQSGAPKISFFLGGQLGAGGLPGKSLLGKQPSVGPTQPTRQQSLGPRMPDVTGSLFDKSRGL